MYTASTHTKDKCRPHDSVTYIHSLLFTAVYSGADSIGHGGRVPHPPILQVAGDGAPWDKQETGQNAPTTTKALTKTTNCTCTAKKVDGTTEYVFRRFEPDICRTTFEFVPVPLALHRKSKGTLKMRDMKMREMKMRKRKMRDMKMREKDTALILNRSRLRLYSSWLTMSMTVMSESTKSSIFTVKGTTAVPISAAIPEGGEPQCRCSQLQAV